MWKWITRCHRGQEIARLSEAILASTRLICSLEVVLQLKSVLELAKYVKNGKENTLIYETYIWDDKNSVYQGY
jgi:hypothetical protein